MSAVVHLRCPSRQLVFEILFQIAHGFKVVRLLFETFVGGIDMFDARGGVGRCVIKIMLRLVGKQIVMYAPRIEQHHGVGGIHRELVIELQDALNILFQLLDLCE